MTYVIAEPCIDVKDQACVDVCPFGAIQERDGIVVVDFEACMGCGVCVSRCAQEALTLVREPSKGEPLEIEAILAGANPSR